MFPHQHQRNPFGEFSQDAVGCIDVMPYSGVCQSRLKNDFRIYVEPQSKIQAHFRRLGTYLWGRPERCWQHWPVRNSVYHYCYIFSHDLPLFLLFKVQLWFYLKVLLHRGCRELLQHFFVQSWFVYTKTGPRSFMYRGFSMTADDIDTAGIRAENKSSDFPYR